MNVLIACEESQEVCKAFRARNHHAFSCDLLECNGGRPEWHIKGDARVAIVSKQFKTQCGTNIQIVKWDKVISFPPCTDLSLSGARWFEKKRLSGEQKESIMFFLAMYNQSNCIENPLGIMNGGKYLKKWFPFEYKLAVDLGLFNNKPQIIQPWHFGHTETKATCLWLKGLSPLVPTDIVGPPPPNMTMEQKGKWNKIHRMPPGPQRAILRSKTYSGIAKAMAAQWSGIK